MPIGAIKDLRKKRPGNKVPTMFVKPSPEGLTQIPLLAWSGEGKFRIVKTRDLLFVWDPIWKDLGLHKDCLRFVGVGKKSVFKND